MKETYQELKKEYPILPEYDSLNKEFDISLIEDGNILREILKKIGERYEPVLETMERIISPDPSSIADMYECRVFTNGEKKQLFDVFRHSMMNYRMLLEADLADEKTQTETIKKAHEAWQNDKKQILPFIKKLKESWQKHIEAKEILEYLG